MERFIENDCVRLTINDGLTANNVTSFNQAVSQLLPEVDSFNLLILDISNTDQIDSVGVTFVISLFKQMKNVNKQFKVAGVSEDVEHLFRLMKLDQFFTLEP